MRLNFVPLASALLPFAALHLGLALTAHGGHVTWCVPYFPDCVSISATGRHAPASWVFRAAIIPTAVLMALYWRLGFAWLEALGTPMARLNRVMGWLGAAAALGLFAYASVLGEVGEAYRLQRRLGMTLFYAFAFLAQLLMTVQVTALARGGGGAPLPATIVRTLKALSAAVAVLGPLSLLSWAFLEDYRRFEDAFEWWITLLILGHTFASYFAWRASGFEARFTVKK